MFPTLRQSLALLVVLLGMAFAGPATADPTTDTVETLLAGYEAVPTAEEWLALGPEGAAVLVEIAGDRQRTAFARSRATAALRHFPGEDTEARLTELLADPTTAPTIQRSAVRAIAVVAPERAPRLIAPVLESTDVSSRELAAKQLVELGTPEAVTALEARLVVEKSALVRTVITEGIARSSE